MKSRTAPKAALTDDLDFGFAEDKLTPLVYRLLKTISKDSPIRRFLLEKMRRFSLFRSENQSDVTRAPLPCAGQFAGWASSLRLLQWRNTSSKLLVIVGWRNNESSLGRR
jgi:hypothetical protein